MFRKVEKPITFLANAITVFTFIGTIGAWLGIFGAPDLKIKEQASITIIIIYTGIVSYGINAYLGERVDEGHRTFSLSNLMAVCFSFSIYLICEFLEKITSTQRFEKISAISVIIAMIVFVIFSIALHTIKICYPNGFNLKQYFIRAFYKETYYGVMISISNIFVIGIMFSLYGMMPKS